MSILVKPPANDETTKEYILHILLNTNIYIASTGFFGGFLTGRELGASYELSTLFAIFGLLAGVIASNEMK